MSAGAIGVALVLAVIGNDPYVRSRVDTGVSNDPDAHCLWWGKSELTFHHDAQGNPETRTDTEFEAARRAMASWADVNDACGHLTIRNGERLAAREIANDEQNVIVYRMEYCPNKAPATDPCWSELECMNKYDCWDGEKATIALTTTTYDVETGQIYDADIEMNGASFVFTTVDAPPCVRDPNRWDLGYNQGCVATDVENTLAHELGHALGLDHTTYPGSTMNASAPAGEVSKRSLDDGTRQYVCDAYPKASPPRDCVIETYDGTLGPKDGCSAAGGAAAGWALLALGLGLRRRRRA